MRSHQYDPASDSLSFPDDTVVGVVDDPDSAVAAVEDLLRIGLSENDIQVLCCDGGAQRLDPSGKRHGVLGRLQRLVQHFGDEDIEHIRRQADELREGNFLIAAPADDEARDRVAKALQENGGRFINHYTSWRVMRLEP